MMKENQGIPKKWLVPVPLILILDWEMSFEYVFFVPTPLVDLSLPILPNPKDKLIATYQNIIIKPDIRYNIV